MERLIPRAIAPGAEDQYLRTVDGVTAWDDGPPALPEPVGAEGQVLTVVTGVPAWADSAGGGGSGGRHLVPLTTVLDGVPQLVWDEDNNLVMTEVTQ